MHDEQMNVVFVGHVDHGKSTVVGRLLAETGALPEGKLEKLKRYCQSNSKPFEYAFLLDALGDEQSQGITIDIARCFFKTNKRKYLILDAPGHIEFMKNLVTGAANAEAAFLVIDAKEGIQENSRRHAYMLSLLGVKEVVVLINKVDLIGYSETKYKALKKTFSTYLKKINLEPVSFIPISGREGDNIVNLSENTPWHDGQTVLEALDGFHKVLSDEKQPFRMHVQDVYKFTNNNDNRRIVAGQVSTGTLHVGDKVTFFPSGKTSTVKSIEAFNSAPVFSVSAGKSTGFTLQEQIYTKRGDVVAIAGQSPPEVASTIKVSLFWLGKKPLYLNADYWFKLGTTKVRAKIVAIHHVLDTSSLEIQDDLKELRYNQAAECTLALHLPIAFDKASNNHLLSRFVLVDKYDIAGGGLIKSYETSKESSYQKRVFERNQTWITSSISLEEREQALQQPAKLILITGNSSPDMRQKTALCLERVLFNKGYATYFIGIRNVKHALAASYDHQQYFSSHEDFRQFSEVLNILFSTGLIVIATAAAVNSQALRFLEMATNTDHIHPIWIGDNPLLDNSECLCFEESKDIEQLCANILENIIKDQSWSRN